MGIEFMSVLKPGPVYVGTLLNEIGMVGLPIIITDESERMQHVVMDDDWRTCVPVYILNKEVKDCAIYEEKGVRAFNVRV